tara:strand:- start:1252 stop:3561 length:2310 start_codon:yes stop_codon:yes gene_type:complete
MQQLNSPEYSSFLPHSLKRFFKRRFKEIFGLTLILLSFFIITSLWFFDPNDPVFFFNSTSNNISNSLGIIGANLSGLLIHLFGLGSILFCFIGFFWGFRLVTHEKINSKKFRVLGLLPSLILICMSLSELEFNFLNLPQGYGGLLGFLGYLYFPTLNEGWVYGYFDGGRWPFCIFAAMIGLPFFFWCSAVSKKELNLLSFLIKSIIKPIYNLIKACLLFIYSKIFSTNNLTKNLSRRDPELLYRDKNRKLKNTRQVHLKKPRQTNLNLDDPSGYQLPSLDLLTPSSVSSINTSEEILNSNSRMLESVLDDFGIKGEISSALSGPVVTRYDLNPSPGTKTSRVVSLADDIARSMSAISVRVAVVPGQNVIGIELPNLDRETVLLREILESDQWQDHKFKIPMALGKDIAGLPIVKDLSSMPHLLVAGTTGSGKSVAINGMILSILYTHTPETCRLILVDPKMLELSVYDGIPHLLTPVVTEPSKAVMALKWAVREMEERYKLMSKIGVRNIDGYNKKLSSAKSNGENLTYRVQTGFDPETGKPIYEEQSIDSAPLPLIVVVIDEVADLMLVAGKDIEAAVQRLAQMARAAGIHVIMATQRPSVDVITGTIKANFPTRISFQVSSKIDSRTILGEQGSEQLLGKGDMLFMEGGGRITRIHGPFVSDREVEKVVNNLKLQGSPEYDEEVVLEKDEGNEKLSNYEDLNKEDNIYNQAVELVTRERRASTSFIQRHLKIGYNRAATIIEKMESDGIVSQANHVGKREILVDENF